MFSFYSLLKKSVLINAAVILMSALVFPAYGESSETKSEVPVAAKAASAPASTKIAEKILAGTNYKKSFAIPSVFEAGKKSTLQIFLKNKKFFANPEAFEIKYQSVYGARDSAGETIAHWSSFNKSSVPFTIDGNSIKIDFTFDGEQEHSFSVVRKDWKALVKKSGKTAKQLEKEGFKRVIAVVKVYSLSPERYGIKAFKSDIHQHSTGSDGLFSPEEVAVQNMKIGIDIFALADHRNIESSRAITEKIGSYPMTMRSYLSEEVSGGGVIPAAHLVSFGASEGIHKWILDNPEQYVADIKKRMEAPELAELSPEARYTVSEMNTIFALTHKFGGLAFWAHPYSRPNEKTLGGWATDAMFKFGDYDALELNANVENGALFLEKWHDEQVAKGKRIPLVGNSDAHTLTSNGKGYSIILATENTFEAIKTAIKNCDSLAVEQFRDGKKPRINGTLRNIKLGYFVSREFFPLHDALCAEESVAFLKVLKGEEKPESLQIYKDAMDKLSREFWGY